MGIFNQREKNYALVTIIILSFVFGFNDKSEVFDVNHWLINFLLTVIAVSISFLVSYIAIKKAAEKIGCETEYGIWSFSRFGFEPHQKAKFMKKEFAFPIGIILPLIITLLSNGLWYFPVVGKNILVEKGRLGKIFSKLTGYERTLIYLAGPLANLVLFFVFLFLSRFGYDFSIFISVNMWLALFGLLPLPNLNGAEMLFGSLAMYLFALFFTVMSILLAPISIAFAIILALIVASTIVIVYFFKISS